MMSKVLIKLLISVMFVISIVGCSISRKSVKIKTIQDEIIFIEERGCFCIPDTDLKFLYREALKGSDCE